MAHAKKQRKSLMVRIRRGGAEDLGGQTRLSPSRMHLQFQGQLSDTAIEQLLLEIDDAMIVDERPQRLRRFELSCQLCELSACRRATGQSSSSKQIWP